MKLFVSRSGDAALEEKTLRYATKAVLDGARVAFLLCALTTGDNDSSDVLARVHRAIAITLPLDVLEIESDGR